MNIFVYRGRDRRGTDYNRPAMASPVGSEPGRAVSKMVFAKSGDCCAMPDCRRPLVTDRTDDGDAEALIGELAHIAGLSPGSARYDETMSDEERNSADNLMAVCPSCHSKIDAQRKAYTAERLRKIKADHEAWVRDTLEKGMHEITFPELDMVISHLITALAEPGEPHAIAPAIKLREKITKNRLSAWTGDMISVGLTRVKLVTDYINESLGDSRANNLKAGMVREYERLRRKGLGGDELFDAMWKLASKNGGAGRSAAGLVVLVYFFEACEVFER